MESILKEAGYTLQKLEGYTDKAELLKAAAGVDAMIIRSDKITEEVLAAADKLKLVVRAGSGFDNVDLMASAKSDVTVMNTPGQNANGVAELVLAMMLCSARNNFDGTSGFELINREIAFCGFGFVAKAVHKLVKGMGMKTFAYDPFIPDEGISKYGATPVKSLEELFTHQYVTLHVPLLDATREYINKNLLERLPKDGTLINTARAGVVHEGDLLEVFKARPDLRYLADVAPTNKEEIKALGNGVIFSAKKMGAQTLEANVNAGAAAATQIVGFFEKGVTKFQVNKRQFDELKKQESG